MLVLTRRKDESVIVDLRGPIEEILSETFVEIAKGRSAKWAARNALEKLGDKVVITVVDVRGDKVRLGISAETSIPVHREEIYNLPPI